MNTEQDNAIAELRALNLSPKQIARKLGLRPAEVKAVIKQQAAQVMQERTISGEQDPIFECLINAAAMKLLEPTTTEPSYSSYPPDEADSPMEDGLVTVTVTRQAGYNRLVVCAYLVDVWCLGVKDAFRPRRLNQSDYNTQMAQIYSFFPDPTYHAISLEQAQAVVFSALEYAEQLGFKPHQDFESARSHLGEWDGQLRIECGRNGKPFYIDGPYDDSQQVMNTLMQTVGEGNFDFIVGID